MRWDRCRRWARCCRPPCGLGVCVCYGVTWEGATTDGVCQVWLLAAALLTVECTHWNTPGYIWCHCTCLGSSTPCKNAVVCQVSTFLPPTQYTCGLVPWCWCTGPGPGASSSNTAYHIANTRARTHLDAGALVQVQMLEAREAAHVHEALPCQRLAAAQLQLRQRGEACASMCINSGRDCVFSQGRGRGAAPRSRAAPAPPAR